MKRKRKISWPIIFILPFFITYFIFNLFPILFSFYISLTKWKGFGPMEFIGFRNYASLATVYKGNIIKNLIMDCQSYTKYRPNETTGGIFVSWRRKEELPTGA